MQKPDREQALAKAALDQMSECGVAPSPDNFELFYLHASGENAAIGQAIAKIIAEKRPFTSQLLQDLRTRVRSDAPAMEQVG